MQQSFLAVAVVVNLWLLMLIAACMCGTPVVMQPASAEAPLYYTESWIGFSLSRLQCFPVADEPLS